MSYDSILNMPERSSHNPGVMIYFSVSLTEPN